MCYLCTVGGVGGVCALANVLGEAVCELQQLEASDRMKEAIQLQKKLIAPNSAVSMEVILGKIFCLLYHIILGRHFF